MKFLDLTQSPPVEQDMNLDAISALLYQQTGRRLHIEQVTYYAEYLHFFKLVRWPDSIGFGIVAAEDIPENTPLFYYGGKLVKNLDASHANGRNFYIQQIDPVGSMYRDGKDYGDFGSLLAHAPDDSTLENMGFSSDDQKAIQTCNTIIEIRDNDFFFYASENIPAGTVITHDYGGHFWLRKQQTFSLFKKNTLRIVDLSTFEFNGNAQIHVGNAFYIRPLLFISQLLLQANQVQNTQNMSIWSDWLMLAANALRFGVQFTLENSVFQTDKVEVFVKDSGVGMEFALRPSDFMPVLQKITRHEGDSSVAFNIRLNSVYGFFKGRTIHRYIQNASIDDCEPPPGSQLYESKTILPNPFKPRILSTPS